MAKKIEMTKEQSELYNQLLKEVKKANQRLVRIEQVFGRNTWASKKLMQKLDSEKLNAWTSSGRIRLNKKMSVIELTAIQKATQNFLNSQTSRIKGIKDVRKKQIEQLQKRFNVEEIELTFEDAEKFYEMQGDDAYNYFRKFFKASELEAIIQESIIERDSEDDFIIRIKRIMSESNDLDFKINAIKLYENFIKPYI